MGDKTKNFAFDTHDKDIFQHQPVKKRNLGGRPKKDESEKMSIAKTVKFTNQEYDKLFQDFQDNQRQFFSFSNYLRYLIFRDNNS